MDRARTQFDGATAPSATQIRDEALMAQAAAGDLEAFNEIVLIYQDYLFALVVRVVHDRDSAADAVQEALFSCYRNLRPVPGRLVPLVVDAHRAQRRDRRAALPQAPPGGPVPGVGGRLVATADREDGPEHAGRPPGRVLTEALAEITSDQRTAIVMYDVEGFDYQEIADITGVSLGTVKSRIHRGRLALRELLSDDMELLRE